MPAHGIAVGHHPFKTRDALRHTQRHAASKAHGIRSQMSASDDVPSASQYIAEPSPCSTRIQQRRRNHFANRIVQTQFPELIHSEEVRLTSSTARLNATVRPSSKRICTWSSTELITTAGDLKLRKTAAIYPCRADRIRSVSTRSRLLVLNTK